MQSIIFSCNRTGFFEADSINMLIIVLFWNSDTHNIA